jgi:broad specificity phosphatase PhoE
MTETTLRVYLVRHGEVEANVGMRYLGRRDDPLNGVGRKQARQLGEVFTRLKISEVCSSPLQRARVTARAIADATDCGLSVDSRLVEMDFGPWEGLTRDEVIARSAQDKLLLERWERDPSVAPPGGESLVAVQNRCLALLNDLLQQGLGSIALVSHVGPIKAMLCAALGLPLAGSRRMFLDPATISVVDWSRRPVLRLFNAHGHLGWSRARWLDG